MSENKKRKPEIETEQVPCPICNGKESKTLFLQPSNGRVFGVVKCCNCKMVYLNPRPTIKEVQNIYINPTEEQVKEDLQPGLRASPGIEERVGFRSKYMAYYIEHTEGGAKKILDVASRNGSFLELLKQQCGPNELHGVEFRSNLAKMTEQKGYKTSLVSSPGSLAEAKLPENYFDIISMRHIMEHSYNPIETLEEVHRILKKGGVVRIEVPNIASFSKMISGKYWNGFYIPWHLNYFSPETLSDLLRKTGFKIIKVKTFPYPHFLLSPLRVFQPLIPKRTYRAVGRGAGTSPFVGKILLPFNLFTYAIDRGDEVMAIGEKD